MSDQIPPLVEELRQAARQMTPRERALGDALMDLAGEVWTAADMLAALCRSDPSRAALIFPLVELLVTAGRNAVGTHAAVVADINRPVVH